MENKLHMSRLVPNPTPIYCGIFKKTRKSPFTCSYLFLFS